MRFLAIAILSLTLSGCSVGMSLYESEGRTVLPVELHGGESFCVDSLGIFGAFFQMTNLGWGQFSCERRVEETVD